MITTLYDVLLYIFRHFQNYFKAKSKRLNKSRAFYQSHTMPFVYLCVVYTEVQLCTVVVWEFIFIHIYYEYFWFKSLNRWRHTSVVALEYTRRMWVQQQQQQRLRSENDMNRSNVSARRQYRKHRNTAGTGHTQWMNSIFVTNHTHTPSTVRLLEHGAQIFPRLRCHLVE